MLRLSLALALVVALLAASSSALTVNFVRLSATFQAPIGIDYYYPENSLISTANYPSGNPFNFYKILFSGAAEPFAPSSLNGQTNEIKIATSRVGNFRFQAGTFVTGNGVNGQIIKVQPDSSPSGLEIINPWVSLPAASGLMRGSLYFDRTGVWDYRLIVCTTAGHVYQIDETGAYTQIGTSGTHLEGLVVAPVEPTLYGDAYGSPQGIAGCILAGNEGNRRMYVWCRDSPTATSYNRRFWVVPHAIEDLDVIEEGENFFGINYACNALMGAAAADFAGHEKEILGAQEFVGSTSGLFLVKWDIASATPTTEAILFTGETPCQWEHVTLAPTGLAEILPPGFDLCLLAETASNEASFNPVVLTTGVSAQVNYAYSPSSRQYQGSSPPGPGGELAVAIVQDNRNRFSLQLVVGGATAGSLSLSFSLVGASCEFALINLQDDPDDNYNYDQPSCTGQITWSWSAGETDGAIIGPLQFVTQPTFSFTGQVTSSSSDVAQWVVSSGFDRGPNNELTVGTDSAQTSTFPIGEPLTLFRSSCSCGDGVVDVREECDEGAANGAALSCCDDYCRFVTLGSLTECEPAVGPCDTPEYCPGDSVVCPDEFDFQCPGAPCVFASGHLDGDGNCDRSLGSGTPCDIAGYFVNSTCVIDCTSLASCGTCGFQPECGWCCQGETGGACQTANAADTGPTTDFSCPAPFVWLNETSQCSCDPTCVSPAPCVCGSCVCPAGTGGEDCGLVRGCTGDLEVPPPTSLDVCGVCGGAGDTCLDCEGVPNGGKVEDDCGVCGGDGSSCFDLCPYTTCDECTVAEGCHWYIKGEGNVEDFPCPAEPCPEETPNCPFADDTEEACANNDVNVLAECWGSAQTPNYISEFVLNPVSDDEYENQGSAVGSVDTDLADAVWVRIEVAGQCNTSFFNNIGAQIGTGVLAAIIIAAIIAIVAVALGSKKGYDYIKHRREGANQKMQTSSIYQDTGNSGVSALHS